MRAPAMAEAAVAELPFAAVARGRQSEPAPVLAESPSGTRNGGTVAESGSGPAEHPSPALVLPIALEKRSERPEEPAAERIAGAQAGDRDARLRAIEARRRREMEQLVAKEDLIRKAVARAVGTTADLDLRPGERRPQMEMPPLVFTLEDDIAQKP